MGQLQRHHHLADAGRPEQSDVALCGQRAEQVDRLDARLQQPLPLLPQRRHGCGERRVVRNGGGIRAPVRGAVHNVLPHRGRSLPHQLAAHDTILEDLRHTQTRFR